MSRAVRPASTAIGVTGRMMLVVQAASQIATVRAAARRIVGVIEEGPEGRRRGGRL